MSAIFKNLFSEFLVSIFSYFQKSFYIFPSHLWKFPKVDLYRDNLCQAQTCQKDMFIWE